MRCCRSQLDTGSQHLSRSLAKLVYEAQGWDHEATVGDPSSVTRFVVVYMVHFFWGVQRQGDCNRRLGTIRMCCGDLTSPHLQETCLDLAYTGAIVAPGRELHSFMRKDLDLFDPWRISMGRHRWACRSSVM